MKMELSKSWCRRSAEIEAGPDPVNRPQHYTGHPSNVECIEIVEGWPFCLGNCFKYLFRCGHKGDAYQDLQKALWYVRREIQRREKMFPWFTGESSWMIGLDGTSAEFDVCRRENRYAGHMSACMMFLIQAGNCPRGLKGLYRAQEKITLMLSMETKHDLA